MKLDTKLTDFIIHNTQLKRDEIKPQLKLTEDIGYHGLDSITFIEAFFTEFEIKNIENFCFDLYIDGRPDFVPRPLNWTKNLIFKNGRKYLNPDVSLEHLQKVIDKGEWFNER
ncbi:MAG: DUF1493 family protein [Sporocytophaga sp.]|uniref:DUF1493 family protein n=1 Tax=Sporocytophaga sp. TaxID=2231183 RepID=UPI001B1A068D|nr:DUF1493 family protein [Sporocytophaga sp.]MBO9703481.1 DUF1493 family protein [Sporocytophaga sp.]